MTENPLATMMVTDRDLRAIGHVAAQWARLEVQIDLLIAVLLDHPLAADIKASLHNGIPPRSFEKRIDRLREMVAVVFQQDRDLMTRIERMIQDASHLRGTRDNIVHGIWKLKRDNNNRLTTGIKIIKFHPFRLEERVLEFHTVEETARKISLVYHGLVLFMQEVFFSVLHSLVYPSNKHSFISTLAILPFSKHIESGLYLLLRYIYIAIFKFYIRLIAPAAVPGPFPIIVILNLIIAFAHFAYRIAAAE